MFTGALSIDDPIPPHERALAFLRIWANSYLLKGMTWDIPQTMGAALNNAVGILSDALATHTDGGTPAEQAPQQTNRLTPEEVGPMLRGLADMAEGKIQSLAEIDAEVGWTQANGWQPTEVDIAIIRRALYDYLNAAPTWARDSEPVVAARALLERMSPPAATRETRG